MKICYKCKTEKPKSEFSYLKKSKDGLRSYCKCCGRKNYADKKEQDPEYFNIYNSKYVKNRKQEDEMFNLICVMRGLISGAFKRKHFKKNSKTAIILGCSFEEFKEYIESQFTEGMSWENQGKWHFDHIYPVSKAIDEEHLIKLNHYTNFQPLWAIDNIKKGNKIL